MSWFNVSKNSKGLHDEIVGSLHFVEVIPVFHWNYLMAHSSNNI